MRAQNHAIFFQMLHGGLFNIARRSCFKSAWRDHCNANHGSLKPPASSSSGSSRGGGNGNNNNGAAARVKQQLLPDEEVDPANEGSAQAALAVPPGADSQSWTECATNKAYVPVAEDLGCVLKVRLGGARCRPCGWWVVDLSPPHNHRPPVACAPFCFVRSV